MALVISLVVQIFLFNPLVVGGRKYFIQSAQYLYNKGCFRFAFNGELSWYRRRHGAQGHIPVPVDPAVHNPGIVKSYAYSMVPYILADNPNIGRGGPLN